MALELQIIKQPHEIAWSGNPMVFSFAISPYGVPEEGRNLIMRLQVMVEMIWGSNNFTEAYSQPSTADNNGIVSIDVCTILDAYLKYFIPPVNNTLILECPEQTRRYKIIYSLSDANTVVIPPAETAVMHAIKGGMAKEFTKQVEYFSSTQNFLTYNYPNDADLYQRGETRFVFFLARADRSIGGSTKMIRGVDVNGEGLGEIYNTIPLKKYRVYCVPISPKYMIPGADETAFVYVEVLLQAIGAQSIRLYVDQRAWYETSELLYRNSQGGLDTITLRGQNDYEPDYDRQTAQRTTFPNGYMDGIMMPEQINTRVAEQWKQKGDTGFITRERLDALRELFLSTEVYQVLNGVLIPVVLNTKNIKLYSNKNRLYAAVIEFQRAFTNEYYTPESLNVAGATCPAMNRFFVKQISTNKLEIMWGLLTPHHQVQVEIIINGTTYSYRYAGNMGKIIQGIINPSVPGVDVNITVRARTVCNPYSTPIDAGPWTTLTLTLTANRPPVAVDNTYNIAIGYTSPVALSPVAITNDYDPDGDAIAAVAASGSTNGGGTFTINAAGQVQYTPPTSAYTGQDWFDYTIIETGGGGLSGTGRIYINVGTGITNNNVFVKIVARNTYNNYTNYSSENGGERWLDYFTDPAGTIPVDVTNKNIVVNIDEIHRTQDHTTGIATSSTTSFTKDGTGIRTKFYEGLFDKSDYDQSWPYTEEDSYRHIIQPGTGYVAI